MCVTTTTQREASSSGFSCDPSSLHYWRCFCGLFKARATALSRSTSTPLPIVELMLSDLKKPFAPEPFKPFGRTCAYGHDMTREPKKRDQSVGCIFAFSKLATQNTHTQRLVIRRRDRTCNKCLKRKDTFSTRCCSSKSTLPIVAWRMAALSCLCAHNKYDMPIVLRRRGNQTREYVVVDQLTYPSTIKR